LESREAALVNVQPGKSSTKQPGWPIFADILLQAASIWPILKEGFKRAMFRGQSILNSNPETPFPRSAFFGYRRNKGGAMAKVNPIQVQKFLGGMHYPAKKDEIVDHAKSKGADENVMNTLEQLPDDNFETPADVSKAIGQIE